MGKRDLLFWAIVLGGVSAFWAALRPTRADRVDPAKPPAIIASPAANPVDSELRKVWSDQGLTPAAPAPELAVMRRISLALTGSIPSLRSIRQFEARPAGERVNWWLEEALADPRSADYLAERLARAFVGVEDGPFILFRRRRFVTWLGEAIREDRPYDQVVRALIADEGLWTDHPSTNFVTVAFDQATQLPDPERLAGRVARAFLGVRLDCAQCHDHPFQPWTRKDFQGLAAFFGQVKVGLRGVRDSDGDYRPPSKKPGVAEAPVAPRVPFATHLLPESGPRRARLAAWATDPHNPNLARATVNRVWALMFGRPLVEPVDDLAAAGDPPPVLKVLAEDFASHGYGFRRLIRTIVASEAFRLDSRAEESAGALEPAWAEFPLTRLRPEQVAGAVMQSAALEPLDRSSHLLVRLMTSQGIFDFIRRHGDAGVDELDERGGTIPQRLLMMNGALVGSKTGGDLITAPAQIALLAPNDRLAVETAYLAALTRRPTPEEAAHFEAQLDAAARAPGPGRKARMSDLAWTLLNATEFSWNH